MKDQQILKIYHLTINLLFNQAICVMHNDFKIFLIAKNQLIGNETIYRDKVLIKIYKSQKFE
jgi:hypothetical protein